MYVATVNLCKLKRYTLLGSFSFEVTYIAMQPHLKPLVHYVYVARQALGFLKY